METKKDVMNVLRQEVLASDNLNDYFHQLIKEHGGISEKDIREFMTDYVIKHSNMEPLLTIWNWSIYVAVLNAANPCTKVTVSRTEQNIIVPTSACIRICQNTSIRSSMMKDAEIAIGLVGSIK